MLDIDIRNSPPVFDISNTFIGRGQRHSWALLQLSVNARMVRLSDIFDTFQICALLAPMDLLMNAFVNVIGYTPRS